MISSRGGPTNQATQTISGTVAAGEAAVGSTVYLYDNGGTTAIGTATVGSGGNWSTSVTLSGDGAHSIVARDTDAAGNTGSSTPVALTLDTLPPTVLISTTGATTNQATQTISGTVAAGEAAVGSTVYLYDNGGTTAIGTATVGSGGNWSTSVTLSGNGSHSIVAQDTDAAGNIGTSAPVTFTLATSVPTIAITPIDGNNIINKSEAAAGVTISGTATAGSAAVNGQTATITIVDSSSVVKDTYTATVTGGTWSVNVTAVQAQALADGSYSIKANVSDAAGNAATTATQAITLDTLPPTVAITSSGGLTNQATQTISGTVAAGEAAVGSTVYLYDNGGTTAIGTATVGSGGNWSTSVTLSGDGAHSIVARDTDAAGNTGSSSALSFTLGHAAADGCDHQQRRADQPGDADDPGTVAAGEAAVGSTVYLYDNGGTTAIGTATVGSGGNWTPA